MPTFLDLYSRLLGELDDETRAEAEELVKGMCASPSYSDEHTTSRRSLVRLLKSRALHLLPSSWRENPDIENGPRPQTRELPAEMDESLRKVWKGYLEEEDVFFWGRVPEWDEIEKHYDGTDHRHPSAYHNSTPGSQKPHGNRRGHRRMMMQLIAHFGPQRVAQMLNAPTDNIRDLVRTPRAGGPVSTGQLEEKWNDMLPNIAGSGDDAGPGRRGENYKLSAVPGSPQDAKDIHQAAETHHVDAGHFIEAVRNLAPDEQRDEVLQAVEKHLRELEGATSGRELRSYLSQQSRKAALARGRLTSLQQKIDAGELDREDVLHQAEQVFSDLLDFRLAAGVFYSRALEGGDPFNQLQEDPKFMGNLRDKVAHTMNDMAHALADYTKAKGGREAPAKPHEMPAAHGHEAQPEGPSHQIVPAEERRAARSTFRQEGPARSPRLPEGKPEPQPAREPAAEPAHEPAAETTPPAGRGARLGETRPPAGRGARLGETTPAAAATEAPPAPKESTDAILERLLGQKGQLMEEVRNDLTDNGRNKLRQWVERNKNREGFEDDFADAVGELRPGTDIRAQRIRQEGARSAAGRAERAAAEEAARAAAERKQQGDQRRAERRQQAAERAQQAAQRGAFNNLPGFGAMFQPGSNQAGEEAKITVKKPFDAVQDQLAAWRKDLQSKVSAGQVKPAGKSKSFAELQSDLGSIEDRVKAAYKSKDAAGVIAPLKEFVGSSGMAAGGRTKDWFGKMQARLEAEFAEAEGKGKGKGVKKSARLPLSTDVPPRLPPSPKHPNRL